MRFPGKKKITEPNPTIRIVLRMRSESMFSMLALALLRG